MTNHPNRAVRYTAYCSEDSSLFRDGLTLSEARDEATERNRGSRREDFWQIMSDSDFLRMQAHDFDESSMSFRVVDGVTKIIKPQPAK